MFSPRHPHDSRHSSFVFREVIFLSSRLQTHNIIDLAATGARMRSFRRAAGLTVTDVCELIGTARYETVRRWETGAALPTLEVLAALCGLYGVTLDDLVVPAAGSAQPPPETPQGELRSAEPGSSADRCASACSSGEACSIGRKIHVNCEQTSARLRRCRLQTGLSLRDVQQHLGLASPSAVSGWETSGKLPSADRLLALSKLYGVSMTSLIAAETRVPGKSAAQYGCSDQPQSSQPSQASEPLPPRTEQLICVSTREHSPAAASICRDFPEKGGGALAETGENRPQSAPDKECPKRRTGTSRPAAARRRERQ